MVDTRQAAPISDSCLKRAAALNRTTRSQPVYICELVRLVTRAAAPITETAPGKGSESRKASTSPHNSIAVDATVGVAPAAARDVASSIAFVAAEASVDAMPAVVSILVVVLHLPAVVVIEARDVDATVDVDAVRDAR